MQSVSSPTISKLTDQKANGQKLEQIRELKTKTNQIK